MPNSRRPSPSSRRAAAASPTKTAKRDAAKPAVKQATASHAAGPSAESSAGTPQETTPAKTSSAHTSTATTTRPAPSAISPAHAAAAESSHAGRPIVELKNLGPATAEWLAEVGIHEQGELARLGSLEAFRLITNFLRKQGEPAPTLNLLFALEGALSDTHWARLPGPRRRELHEQGTEVLREGSSS